MNVPADGGNHSDPDQDQTSGTWFNDPTAPDWADPTAPDRTPSEDDAPPAPVQDTPPAPRERPAPPTPPGGAFPYGQQPAPPQVSRQDAPPRGNPYAQQPAPPPSPLNAPPRGNPYTHQPAPPPSPQDGPPGGNPYAQRPPVQQPGQPHPSYGQPQPGQPYPSYGQPSANAPQPPPFGQNPHGTAANPNGPANPNGSAIALTIVSLLSICNFLTWGSLALGIVALTKSSTQPEDSRRLANFGWVLFAVAWFLAFLTFTMLIIFGVFSWTSGSSDVVFRV